MIRVLALALALTVAGCSSQAADRVAQSPSREASALPRVVSINPCVDAVLLQIADPKQIAAISSPPTLCSPERMSPRRPSRHCSG